MKKIVLLALCSLFTCCGRAQMHAYSTNFTFSEADFADTIHIEVVDGQIMIPAVAGGITRRFCFDTGSGQGTVYAQDGAIPYKEVGNVVSRDAAGHQDTTKVAVLPDFRLGHLEVKGYVASVFKQQVSRKYDAIIGFDFINKGLCCKIDLRCKIMILTDRRNLFDDETGYTVGYKLHWWVPYILVSPFKRHWDEVLFDTGSRQLFTMNKQSFDKHAYKSKQVNAQVEQRVRGHVSIGNMGTEQDDEVAFLKLERLRWDNFSFTNVRAITTQGASRVGADILKYGTITIDGFRRKIIFAPYDGRDSVEVNNKSYTIAYVPWQGKVAVGLVVPGCNEYKAGLRQGDILLEVDGKPLKSFIDFQRFPFVIGHSYELLVRTKEGKTKKVTITR